MTSDTRLRRGTAALLVIEAALISTPTLAVAAYVSGARIIGTSLAHVPVPDVVGQGLAQAATPLATVLLLLAAWGVWHGSRGLGALVLQPTVTAFAAVPFLRPMTAIDILPLGPWLLVLIAAVTTVGLVAVIARTRPTEQGHLRWWWLVAYVLGVVLLAAVATEDRGLPKNPTDLLADAGFGAPPPPGRAARAPEQNPGLAPDPFNSIHNDSWATDSYPRATGPSQPATAPVESLFTGGDCATITFDSRGRLITLCSTLTQVLAYVIDPTDLSVLAQQVVGTRRPDLTDFSGGGYFILDHDDRIVFPAAGGVITIVETRDELRTATQIDVSATLSAGERVTSVLPDWHGRYWYVGNLGTVGVVASSGGHASAITLSGESIENSFAVTRDAVYVVTGAAAYRLRAPHAGPPEIVWRTPYDVGTRQKPGQTSRASGTTPTVFAGGRFIAFTDNADPRMDVVVVSETGDVTCREPVFQDSLSATENSIIAAGSVLVVENNFGYSPPIAATTGGHSTTSGLTAIDVDDTIGSCRTRWHNDQITIPSLVSKAAPAGNVILTYTKPPSAWGVDAWYFTGVDLRTGDIAWQRLAGTGIAFNNHYAGGYLSPSGDFVVGTVNGLVVLRNPR